MSRRSHLHQRLIYSRCDKAATPNELRRARSLWMTNGFFVGASRVNSVTVSIYDHSCLSRMLLYPSNTSHSPWKCHNALFRIRKMFLSIGNKLISDSCNSITKSQKQSDTYEYRSRTSKQERLNEKMLTTIARWLLQLWLSGQLCALLDNYTRRNGIVSFPLSQSENLNEFMVIRDWVWKIFFNFFKNQSLALHIEQLRKPFHQIQSFTTICCLQRKFQSFLIF